MLFNKRKALDETRAWQLYKQGREHHCAKNMYNEARRCRDFYEGNQWREYENGADMPQLNFIKPIGRHKIASIAQNKIAMVFSSDRGEAGSEKLCEALSRLASSQWETADMDSLVWSVVKNAFITGGHYVYCSADSPSVLGAWRPRLKIKTVSNTAVYLSDEQNSCLDEQEYILIAERLLVSSVRRIAEENGMSAEDAELIISDDEPLEGYEKIESKGSLGKCTSVLLMEKTREGILFSRSTAGVVYQPPQLIKGLFRYPVAGMRWEESDLDARGISGVKHLIANQLEVNRTAARRAVAVKRFSFPTVCYDKSAVTNIEGLSEIGASIALDNAGEGSIDSIIQYLNPAPISNDAARLQNELLQLSRELDGASDAATGLVDPTKASGEAIKAARDQAAIPLSEQASGYRAFIEELARVWLSLWAAYSGNGLLICEDGKEKIIKGDELFTAMIDVKVDISPVDPYSRLSQEIALERLLSKGHISFEEYVESIDDTSGLPKAKLKAILEKRG